MKKTTEEINQCQLVIERAISSQNTDLSATLNLQIKNLNERVESIKENQYNKLQKKFYNLNNKYIELE